MFNLVTTFLFWLLCLQVFLLMGRRRSSSPLKGELELQALAFWVYFIKSSLWVKNRWFVNFWLFTQVIGTERILLVKLERAFLTMFWWALFLKELIERVQFLNVFHKSKFAHLHVKGFRRILALGSMLVVGFVLFLVLNVESSRLRIDVNLFLLTFLALHPLEKERLALNSGNWIQILFVRLLAVLEDGFNEWQIRIESVRVKKCGRVCSNLVGTRLVVPLGGWSAGVEQDLCLLVGDGSRRLVQVAHQLRKHLPPLGDALIAYYVVDALGGLFVIIHVDVLGFEHFSGSLE